MSSFDFKEHVNIAQFKIFLRISEEYRNMPIYGPNIQQIFTDIAIQYIAQNSDKSPDMIGNLIGFRSPEAFDAFLNDPEIMAKLKNQVQMPYVRLTNSLFSRLQIIHKNALTSGGDPQKIQSTLSGTFEFIKTLSDEEVTVIEACFSGSASESFNGATFREFHNDLRIMSSEEFEKKYESILPGLLEKIIFPLVETETFYRRLDKKQPVAQADVREVNQTAKYDLAEFEKKSNRIQVINAQLADAKDITRQQLHDLVDELHEIKRYMTNILDLLHETDLSSITNEWEKINTAFKELSTALNVIESEYKKLRREEGITAEVAAITTGIYQEQIDDFTYEAPSQSTAKTTTKQQKPNENFVIQKEDKAKTSVISTDKKDNSKIKTLDVDGSKKSFSFYPMINEPGVRATAAILNDKDADPIEIQLNFFGTIDFASKLVDMEKGGPGQESLKKYEALLLKRLNALIQEVSEKYPDREIRLRIGGHSLGGSLAKGFTHSLQKAIALEKNSPEEIKANIKKNLDQQHVPYKENDLDDLQHDLERNAQTFGELGALAKIEGISVYCWGSPGVSFQTDKNATLMTHDEEPIPIRLYNHHDEKDRIIKFGECELFSGKQLPAKLECNKLLTYDSDVTQDDLDDNPPLPFPGITREVMAAHNNHVRSSRGATIPHTVTDVSEASDHAEKFNFSRVRRALYDASFGIAKFMASFKAITLLIPSLKSYVSFDVSDEDLEVDLDKGTNTSKPKDELGSKIKSMKAELQNITGKNPDTSEEKINQAQSEARNERKM